MIFVRVIVSILVYFIANQLVFLLLSAVISGGDNPAFFASVLAILGGLAAAIAAWVHPAWKGRATLEGSALAYVSKGALVVGAIGFCGGFFGPMIFAPDANQGPMLGIFITGPLGVVFGAIGGFVYSLMRRPA